MEKQITLEDYIAMRPAPKKAFKANKWIDQVELSVWRETANEMHNIPAIEALKKEVMARLKKIEKDCEHQWDHSLFSWGDV